MSQNIRLAQFGGVGGGGSGSPFSPGKSPIGSGGNNTGGHQINTSWDEEQTLEKLLSRTHLDFDDSDRNFETRLTPQHQHVEDLKNYALTPEERLREKFRRELHNYKKSLEEHANSLKKNSVEYIRANYQPKPEHVITLEERLEQRRIHKPGKVKFEDDLPELIKPERSHSVLSDTQINRIAQISMRGRITQDENEDVEKRNVFDKARFTHPPIGRTPVLTEGSELEEYFSLLRQEAAPNDEGQRENANTDTIYTESDPDYNPNIHPKKEIADEPSDNGINDIDVFVSLEGNLNPMKSPKNRFDRNNMGNEDMGVEEIYDGSSFFGIHTPAVFK